MNVFANSTLQMGSFFGSVLCAADVNGDSLDDLLVGAPMFSTNNTEEGRVYVYINQGSVRMVLNIWHLINEA